jgi:antitoxin component of RelBE/YafQ-DinJ toxin-antitoxin module
MATQAQKDAKKRYTDKNYQSLQVFLKKELVTEFKNKLKGIGITQHDVIRYFVKDFIVNSEKYIEPVKQKNAISIKELEQEEKNKRLEAEHEKIMSYTSLIEIMEHFQCWYELPRRNELFEYVQYLELKGIDKKTPRIKMFNALVNHYNGLLQNRGT